jgi:hypothetical protein
MSAGVVVADVSVRARESGAGIEVRFEFPTTGEIVRLPLPDRRPLEAVRRKAGMYLERAVPVAARLNATTEQAATTLRVLLNAGGSLSELLAPNRAHFLSLQDAFRAAWPLWESWADPDSPVPIVQMDCHDETLPLELLPVFDYGSMPPLRTYDELARAAARFLGFAAVVRRVGPDRVDADRVIHNEPALPVQVLRHHRLPSARREARFLASLGAHVRVEGPWPVAERPETVADALLRALYAGHRLDGLPTDPPVQVHHFACHCDTTATHDDDYTLRLSTKRGWWRDISISLGELRQAYREWLVADRDHQRRRAIVVLNACASSRTNPLTADSFARWFIASGHRAFIGTETDVPDSVASAFAAAFYGRLLEACRPLGEAVTWARRDLLRDFRNPLGLLYVTYGDTDLAVAHALPGIYRAGL